MQRTECPVLRESVNVDVMFYCLENW